TQERRLTVDHSTAVEPENKNSAKRRKVSGERVQSSAPRLAGVPVSSKPSVVARGSENAKKPCDVGKPESLRRGRSRRIAAQMQKTKDCSMSGRGMLTSNSQGNKRRLEMEVVDNK